MFPFFLKFELANYTVDSTMCSSDKNVDIMPSLNFDFAILSNWFYKNFMIFDTDKCSFMLFGVKEELQTTVADWYSMGRIIIQTR